MKGQNAGSGLKGAVLAGGLSLCAALLPALTEAAEFAEYKVKAEFLVKLAQFVEWPAASFGGPHDPLVIAIVGKDPFGDYLEEIARARTVNGRRLKIVHAPSGLPPETCHLLFIPAGEYFRLRELLDAYEGRPVLTVGDGERFARRGAQIGIYLRGQRLRFDLNLAGARRSGLSLSSKLLRLAAAVHGGEGQ